MASPVAPLADWLARLQSAGLADDATQLLDALWLACHLPGPAADRNAAGDAARASAAAGGTVPLSTPPAPPPRRAGSPGALSDVEITLQRPAAETPPAPQGVYAHANAQAEDGTLRARAIRVAGVPALRDGPALARALRPLGKRRRSRTRFVLDEAATVDRFADTGMLLPVLAGERERFFAATLLMEDSPALPLWRSLADELEALLARQGGFRSFRRMALTSVEGRLHLRSRSGALHPPRMLLEDDASLVLIATDGTTDAWSDGRMAALAAELGGRTALAVLQWMPERLWPHTALGGADLTVQSPRAGAPLAELKVTRPRWLRSHEPVLPMPLAALTPAAFGRLAAVLMAKPGARTGAGLLWAAPQPEPDGAPPEPDEEDLAALTPAQRIARFRGVASARVLQAAVQLSAAAPLTLPVVRLVHRVMQPGAPAEDLPLLLLGGLLERAAPTATAAPAPAGENEVVFDFPPGVRQALQASLLKHEADAVRRAVSTYIAERSGGPVDFSALLLDPEGPLRLPEWARPFAEVNRQVQALFTPPPQQAEPAAPLRLRERAWAPGVTVQAEAALPSPARQIAWSPDGQRLAVRHGHGVLVLRRERDADGRQGLEREPLAMMGPTQLFVVQGFDIAEDARQAVVDGLQAQWPALFRGELRLQFHTVGPEYASDLRRRPEADLRRMVGIAARQQALVLCIGGPRFYASAWAQAAEAELLKQIDFTALLQPVISVQALQAPADAQQRVDWEVRRLIAGPVRARLREAQATGVGGLLARLLADDGAQSLSQAGFGPRTGSLLWTEDQRLLVLDEARRAVVDEADLSVVQDLSPRFTDQPAVMALQPGASSVAGPVADSLTGTPPLTLARGRDLLVELPAAASLQAHADGMEAPITGLDWSAGGEHLAVRLATGTVRLLWTRPGPSGPVTLPDLRGVACGPAWAHHRQALALAQADGTVQVRSPQEVLTQWPAGEAVSSLAWSHDDALLACGLASGAVQVAQMQADGRVRTSTVEAPDGAAEAPQLAFVPSPLDRGYEALAHAAGTTLHLLRIDTAALQAQQASSAVPAAPVADPDPAPEALPEPDDVVTAACAVLHALAQAFHAGAMAPGTDPVTERYAHRLTLRSGMPGRATLDLLVALSGEVIGGPVREALEGGPDPLAHPDTEAGAVRWRRAIGLLDAALQALLPAEVADTPDNRSAISLMQEWLVVLEAVLEDLPKDDRAALDAALGFPAAGWLASLAPLREPVIRTFGEALRRRLPMLQSLHGSLRALQGDTVVELLAPSVARAAWLRAEHGPSAFSGCRRLADFVGRFAGALAQACESLLDGAPPAPLLHIACPVLQSELSIVDGLAAPLDLRLVPDRGGQDPTAWSIRPADVAPTVRLLGAILASRLAWSAYQPPPDPWAVPGLLALWVDDQPHNNLSAVQELQQRGFRVRTALDTASALALLESGLPVEVVLSDMGRPPDERAGYTLLDEMRRRGFSQPFMIFSRAPRPEHREEAVRRGAVGTTDDFETVLGWLCREFLQRPAIKRAA